MTTFTVFATGKLANPNRTLADVEVHVRAALREAGVVLIPCNWAPDPDTIADATDADVIELLDLN